MGTICILLGVILLILAILGGFLVSHVIVGNELFMSLLGMQSTTLIYVCVVGAFFLVGLLVCLNLVMHGLTYNLASKNNKMLRRIMHK